MILIRSRLGNDIHDGAPGEAVFRVVFARVDLDFSDCLDGGDDSNICVLWFTVEGTLYEHAVRIRIHAANRSNLITGVGDCRTVFASISAVIATSPTVIGARHQVHLIQGIPIDIWESIKLFVRESLRKFGRFRFHSHNTRSDLNRLPHLAHTHIDIRVCDAARIDRHVRLNRCLEPGFLRLKTIGARNQEVDKVVTRRRRFRGCYNPRFMADCAKHHIRDRCATWIRYSARNPAGIDLSLTVKGAKKQEAGGHVKRDVECPRKHGNLQFEKAVLSGLNNEATK